LIFGFLLAADELKVLSEMKKLITVSLMLMTAVLVSGCWDEVSLRSDKPLSRVSAFKEFAGFPFPASAHSIYYFMNTGGMQDLEQYVRFDVNPADLDSSVDELIAWNNKQMARILAYPRKPLVSGGAVTPRKEFLPMDWWDPTTITTGYYRGHMDSYALQIFVDQSRSRIYIYQND
jgi:hypothetical protein